MSSAACESEAEARGDAPVALESCGELCFADLSDAARQARASHPAYAGRFRVLARPCEPPQSA